MADITMRGYHNHRRQEHSDTVAEGLFQDLLRTCESLRKDHEKGIVRYWMNMMAPGGRGRKLDLWVGKPDPGTGRPDISELRIGVENKSVITAHRNRTSRFDDLRETLEAIQSTRREAILIATVLLGTARRVLNVPDKIATSVSDFETSVRHRLSVGDEELWGDFPHAVSRNSVKDPAKTLELLRQLPTRHPTFTHERGYDYVLVVPVFVDNVAVPFVARTNNLGLDVDLEYEAMLNVICRAYTARWHT